MRPHGFEDELRAVLRADGSPWALLALYRAEGEPAFDADESGLVAGLSGAARRGGPRARAPGQAAAPATHDRHGPGLMLFAPDGELISVNDDARAWLDELGGEFARARTPSPSRCRSSWSAR